MKQTSRAACCILSAAFAMSAFLPVANAKADSEQQQRVKPLTSNVQNFVQESLSQTFLKTSANTSATLPRNKNATEEVADKDIHIGESEADYEYSQYYDIDITVASSNYVSTAADIDFTPLQEQAEEINLEDIQLPNRVYSNKLDAGDNSAEVALVQQRLMNLHYMESDITTGFYGSSTQNAIELFQRANEIAIDGVAGRETLDLLFSGNAKTYTIRPGDKGTDIQNIQNRLMELEYYWGAHNGIYDDKTVVAMKLFQQKNGLYDDGIIGQQTMDILFSSEAVIGKVPKPTPTPTPTPKPTPKPVSQPSSGGSSGGGGGGGSTSGGTSKPSAGGGGGGGSAGSGTADGATDPSVDGVEGADPNVDAPIDGGGAVEQPPVQVEPAPEPEAPVTVPDAPSEPSAPEPDTSVSEPEPPAPEPETPATEPEPPADSGNSNSGSSNSSGNSSNSGGSENTGGSGNSNDTTQTTPDEEPVSTPKPDTAAPSSTPAPSSTDSSSSGSGSSGSGSSDAPSSGSGTVSAFIEVANAQSGKKYRLGGNGPSSFDCSGFVYYSLNNSGKKVSRLSAAGYYSNGWPSVGKSNWQVGDLLFFYRPGSKSIGHVGIYVGGNKMIHASTSEGKILTTNLSQPYWVTNYAGARRVF